MEKHHNIPFFIIEDNVVDASSIIYLVYKSLTFQGVECTVLVQLDIINISDLQEENHKIALERLVAIKHGEIVNTSCLRGGEV